MIFHLCRVFHFAPQLDRLPVNEIEEEHELVVVAEVGTRRPVPPDVRLKKRSHFKQWPTVL
jgi:hypothetical protein